MGHHLHISIMAIHLSIFAINLLFTPFTTPTFRLFLRLSFCLSACLFLFRSVCANGSMLCGRSNYIQLKMVCARASAHRARKAFSKKSFLLVRQQRQQHLSVGVCFSYFLFGFFSFWYFFFRCFLFGACALDNQKVINSIAQSQEGERGR